jgi:hypothetical protein
MDKYEIIKDEIEKNQEIKRVYSVEEIESRTTISIKYIKICRRKHKIVRFECIITETDWDNLLKHLRMEDNKVLGVDFEHAGIDNYFHKFLDKLREPNLYIYFSYIYFGNTNLGSRKLIKLASFLLSYYSTIERKYPPNMFSYLLMCRDQYFTSERMKFALRNKNSFNNKNSTIRTQEGGLVYGSNADDNESLFNSNDDDELVKVTMFSNRNFTIFDYKVFFALSKILHQLTSIIEQFCPSVKFNVSISETKFKPPPDFDPNGLWFSSIRSVLRGMDYYVIDEDVHDRINYRLLLILCYINFFTLIIWWIVVPITHKEEWGLGLKWRAHYILLSFITISFIVEFSMFFIAIPRDLLWRIIDSLKGDLRDKANVRFAKLLAVAINSWFFISGFISKADIYTDVGFAMEAFSWGYPVIGTLAFVFFVGSIMYQIYSFIKLLFKIHVKNWVYPVTEQTARLLLWAEFRWLAVIFEKFSLTYYTKIWRKIMHTPKLLSFVKCFFEDLPQCCLQAWFLISERGTKSFIVYISILFSVSSFIISFICFLIATTSILSNEDYKKIKESGIITNFTAPAESISSDSTAPTLRKKEGQSFASSNTKKFLTFQKSATNVAFERFKEKISRIRSIPHKTKKAKELREKMIAKLREENKDNIEKDSFKVELDKIDEDTKEDEDAENVEHSVHVFKPSSDKNIVFETTKELPRPSKLYKEEKRLQEEKIKQSLNGKTPDRIFWWFKPGKIQEVKHQSEEEVKANSLNATTPFENITADVKDFKKSELIPAVPLDPNYRSNIDYSKLSPIPTQDEVKYTANDRLHSTKSKFFDSISSDTSDGRNGGNLKQLYDRFEIDKNNKFYDSWKKNNNDK